MIYRNALVIGVYIYVSTVSVCQRAMVQAGPHLGALEHEAYLYQEVFVMPSIL